MTTVVNQPAPTNESNNSSNSILNTVLALILILGIVYVFFAYALPALRNASAGNGNGVGTPQINVPGKIDVDVNQPNNKPGN